MGIEFKINVKSKITLNGKEYGSVEDVPPEQRDVVQNALAQAGAPGAHKKFTVNGTGYDSPEEMPPDVRATYEQALEKAKTVARRTGAELPTPQTGIRVEGGLSPKTLAIIVFLAILALMIKYFTAH
ncbi:MAG: hypothetical protein WCK76_08275 [Elusimicrobiota bacterium]